MCVGRLWQSMQSREALRSRRELLRSPLVVDARVFRRHLSLQVADFDVRDHLLLPVGRRVGNPVLDHHVPVDARPSRFRAAAPRLHPEADLLGGVPLVVPEVGVLQEPGPEELGGPMALLARLPRRAQVLDRGRDGPGIRIDHDRDHLAQPGDLRLDEPLGAFPDVAVHAAHPRVGRGEVGGILRLHHGVAECAAELDGLAVEEGVVRDEGHEDRDEESSQGEVTEPLPLDGVVQVEVRVGERLVRPRPAAPEAFAAHPVQEESARRTAKKVGNIMNVKMPR